MQTTFKLFSVKTIFILLALFSSVYAEEFPQIINFSVYEKEKYVDIKFLFDNPYNGKIVQKKNTILNLNMIDINLNDINIGESLSSRTKNINSFYISQVDLTNDEINKVKITLTVPSNDINLKLGFLNKEQTMLGLRLENSNESQKEENSNIEEEESNSELPTLKIDGIMDFITPQYLIAMGILVVLIVLLVILKKRLLRKKAKEDENLLNESISDFEDRTLDFDEQFNKKMNSNSQNIRKVKKQKKQTSEDSNEKKQLTEEILKNAFRNSESEEPVSSQKPQIRQSKPVQAINNYSDEDRELALLKQKNLKNEANLIKQQTALYEELLDKIENLNRMLLTQEQKILESSKQNDLGLLNQTNFETLKDMVEPSGNMNVIFQDVDDTAGVVTMLQIKNRRYLVLQNEQGNLLLDRFAISQNGNPQHKKETTLNLEKEEKNQSFTDNDVNTSNSDIKALFEDSEDIFK